MDKFESVSVVPYNEKVIVNINFKNINGDDVLIRLFPEDALELKENLDVLPDPNDDEDDDDGM